MCGIDGFFSVNKGHAVGEKYYNAHKLLSHRGPDDEGFVALNGETPKMFLGNNSQITLSENRHIKELAFSRVVLGHTRLSIIDLSIAGHQPMSDKNGRYYLVFNGEIYNYLELKKELISLGCSFGTTTDSEVVLKAIITWGKEAFNKFNGMWALAFWDSKKQELWLSRDRFGIKPLFVCEVDGSVVFASEIKFIREFLQRQFDLNYTTVERYLNRCRLNCDCLTFWQGINELAPAHVYIYNRHGKQDYKYWQYTPKEYDWNFEDAVSRFAELFQDAVRLRLRSDVAVGVTLSGGLDSNLVAQEMVALGTREKLKAFSAVYNEEEYSEKMYVDRTKSYLGLDVQYVYPEVDGVRKKLDKILYYTEEPIRTLSVYSLYSIYEYIRKYTDFKVILNGQGSDELFGGYTSDYYHFFTDCLLHGEIGKFIQECKLYSKNRGYSYWEIGTYTLWGCLKNLISGKRFNDILFEGVTTAALREYLLYDDRMSMAFGVETRAPFMDYRLVEFAYTLKKELKINNFKNKVIPRAYGEGKIDDSILLRKDKMGYVSPHFEWQQGVLREFVDKYAAASLKNCAKYGVSDSTIKKILGRDLSPERKWRLACWGRWVELNIR